MTDILERRPLAEPTPPRVPEIRRISGRLARINGYLMMSFAAALGSGPPPDFARGLPFIAMARAGCRDPDPGPSGPRWSGSTGCWPRPRRFWVPPRRTVAPPSAW